VTLFVSVIRYVTASIDVGALGMTHKSQIDHKAVSDERQGRFIALNEDIAALDRKKIFEKAFRKAFQDALNDVSFSKDPVGSRAGIRFT
jgi:hypothetical protein